MQEKLQEISKNYGSLVSSVCRKMIADPARAEDAAQNIWLIICQKIDQFQNKSSLSTWIYTIAGRECLRLIKKARTEEKIKPITYDQLIDEYKQNVPTRDIAIYTDEKIRVKNCCDACLTGVVCSLNPEERLAFLLRYLGDLSYMEISLILGKSEAATRKYTNRAKEKFKRFLSEECGYFKPGSLCRCNMADPVKRNNLEKEFREVQKTAESIHFLKQWDLFFPPENFWKDPEKIIASHAEEFEQKVL